jgi:homoaconitase
MVTCITGAWICCFERYHTIPRWSRLVTIARDVTEVLPALIMLAGSRRGVALLRRTFATYDPVPERNCVSITPPYPLLLQKLKHVRRLLDRPLTLAEKILYSHLVNPEKNLTGAGTIRGETYLQLRPERVAMQDASAQ